MSSSPANIDPAIQLEIELFRAISAKNPAKIKELCAGHPELVRDHKTPRTATNIRETWLSLAIRFGDFDALKAMIELGFSPNALNLPEGTTALEQAIWKLNDDMVSALLENGADPNFGRPAISAINKMTPEKAVEFLGRILKLGWDINRQYEMNGDPNKLFTALDWTRQPLIVDFLKSHGAKTAFEISPQTAFYRPAAVPDPVRPLSDQVVHFSNRRSPRQTRGTRSKSFPREYRSRFTSLNQARLEKRWCFSPPALQAIR